eukprot:COSAG01_NODE_177_length_22954_cov_28.699554_25_plen_106_part_00
MLPSLLCSSVSSIDIEGGARAPCRLHRLHDRLLGRQALRRGRQPSPYSSADAGASRGGGGGGGGGGGESFLRVHWVAVPKALRARCVNRRESPRSDDHRRWRRGG